MKKLNSKFLKKLSVGAILVPHIDLYQMRAEFPETWDIQIRNHRTPDMAFHPSGDCLKSPQELYDRLMGKEPNKVPASLRRIFDCGHFWHGYYQEIVYQLGFTTRENIEHPLSFKHEDGWEARGTADLIIDLPLKGVYLVDMKTMNDKEYDEGPYPDTLAKWTAQVNMYMEWLGIHRAFILAIRKGGSPGRGGQPAHGLREIEIPYKPELVQEIYNKWSFVWKCFTDKTSPEELLNEGNDD